MFTLLIAAMLAQEVTAPAGTLKATIRMSIAKIDAPAPPIGDKATAYGNFGPLISQLLTIHRVAFMFGWAKPVPVSAWKFKDPRRGMAAVAVAGPALNFFLAWVAALLLSICLPLSTSAPVTKLLLTKSSTSAASHFS